MSVLGTLFVAKTIDNGDGTYSYGLPSVTLSGSSRMFYQESGIDPGLDRTPMKTIVWREITRGIEPPY